jgi:hypothetical protein
MTTGLSRRLAAEALGTALLLAVVVGSGIMGERLAGGNVAIALLANSIATGGAVGRHQLARRGMLRCRAVSGGICGRCNCAWHVRTAGVLRVAA